MKTPTSPPSALPHPESVRAQFGPVAAHYASADVHRAGPDLTAMLASVRPRGDEVMLDVGCGAGHTALAFAPHVARVEALDLTPPMLRQVDELAAQRGIANIETRLGDVHALPHPDATFDLVTCRLCAHHFHRPVAALREMARVLAPDGVLLLVDIVAPEEPDLDTFLNTIELLRDPSHVRDHSLSQWGAMLGEAGLGSEVLGTWPLRLDFESWVRRIGAAPAARSALRTAFAAATQDVRVAMGIDDDLGFELRNALIRARRA